MPATTPLLSDIITYVRRIIKQPNQQDISDVTIQEYVNRFYIYDVPARVQLFDLKTQFNLELEPNVDQYNAPITTLPGGPVIPVYNLFETPGFVDGYRIVWQQKTEAFTRLFPNYMQNQFQQNGNGSAGPYTFNIANNPIVRGHRDQNIQPATNLGLLNSNVYINTIDVGGNNIFVQDDGNGILLDGATQAPVGNINYLTGLVSNLIFTSVIPSSSAINSQCIPYQAGRPQAVLFFDNIFRFRPIPDKPYLFTCDAYYTPTAFLTTTDAVVYRWMAEYIARGTARKILTDYGDADQLTFYEPYFREQENFVLRRTSRQNQVIRTPTIFSGQVGAGIGSGTSNQL